MVNFICDTPGCKSYCSLAPTDEKNAPAMVRARGWTVLWGKDGKVLKSYCPTHRTEVEEEPVEVLEDVPTGE